MRSRSFSRRRVLILPAAVMPFARALPAPAQEPTGDPEAVALLHRAATAMGQLDSFRFRLTTQDGTTTIFQGVELESVEGAVQRPDRFTATINALVAFVPLSLDVVGVDNTLWVEDPLAQDGSVREVSVASGLADLLNPDRLFLEAVGLIENAAVAGEDEVDGVEATVIEGEFRPMRALELVGTPVPTPEPEEMERTGFGLVLDEPLFTQVWIDGQDRVVQMAFAGRLTTAEEEGIVRVLRLLDFDQLIEITPPATSGG